MSQFSFPSDTYYGIPVLKDDSAEIAQKFTNLSNVLRQNQADSDQQRMAEMAAQRLSQYGEQGAAWGDQIRRDPRAALMMAEQYGGFGAIEEQLAGARAQGDFTRQIADMQARGANPQDIVDLYIRSGNPAAAKQVADAYGVGSVDGPTSYKTEEGVYIRDSAAPGGYRRVGSTPKGELIQFGDSGMKPEQAIAAEDRAAGRVDERVKPLEASMDAYDAFLEVYNNIKARDGVPTLAESDTLAKLASRVETGEAVNEGDVTRKAGGGFVNALRARAGIGVMMAPETMEEVAKTTAAVASARRKKLAEIRSAAQNVAEGRGLNPNAVAPHARQLPEGVPPGSKWDASVQVWESPDGRFFAED